MPDYKQLYYQMFRANEQALRVLLQAQQAAEEAMLAAADPPLTLLERDAPPHPAPADTQKPPSPGGEDGS